MKRKYEIRGFGFAQDAGKNPSGRIYNKVCEGMLFQSALLFIG